MTRIHHLQCAVLCIHLVEQRDAPLFHRLRSPYTQPLMTAANLVWVGRSQNTVAVTPLPGGSPLLLIIFFYSLLHLIPNHAGFFLWGKEYCVGHQQLARSSHTGWEWRVSVLEISSCAACQKLCQQTIPKGQYHLPVGTFSAPQKPHLLHLGLQLLLPGPAAVQQGQPLLQACVLPDCELNLLLCSLPAAALRSYLALKGLDGALESRFLLLWVWVSVSVVGKAVWWPESLHMQTVVGLLPEPGTEPHQYLFDNITLNNKQHFNVQICRCKECSSIMMWRNIISILRYPSNALITWLLNWIMRGDEE